jgi:hypothetical protein
MDTVNERIVLKSLEGVLDPSPDENGIRGCKIS